MSCNLILGCILSAFLCVLASFSFFCKAESWLERAVLTSFSIDLFESSAVRLSQIVLKSGYLVLSVRQPGAHDW